MTIHKEGTATLVISLLFFAILNWLIASYSPPLYSFVLGVSIVLYLFLISFFRNPNRSISATNDNIVLAPCDGKIVVIEETTEVEYLQEKCIQVSIFMSPLNVHVNRHAVNGTIEFYKYHAGKYLAAWNPKASTENERTTTVYTTTNGKILVRQIAGALARRIVCYAQKGQKAIQGEELGFIKLGSRMDLYLPIGTKINVKIGDVVKGNINTIATFK
ncbi:MAG: phosphatidylserine decarboxylase family protein [Saprospiraceae bacterium]